MASPETDVSPISSADIPAPTTQVVANPTVSSNIPTPVTVKNTTPPPELLNDHRIEYKGVTSNQTVLEPSEKQSAPDNHFQSLLGTVKNPSDVVMSDETTPTPKVKRPIQAPVTSSVAPIPSSAIVGTEKVDQSTKSETESVRVTLPEKTLIDSSKELSQPSDDISSFELEKGKTIFILIQIVINPVWNYIQNLRNKIFKTEGHPVKSLPDSIKELLLSVHSTRQIVQPITQLPEGGSTNENIPGKKFPWPFLLIVGFPTFVAIIYFGFIASDQYETKADFVIKTQTTSSSQGGNGIMSMINMASGSGGSQDSGDSAMVMAYVGSAQILKDISKDIDIRKVYSSKDIDWFSRLKPSHNLFKRISGHKTRRTTTNAISDEDLLQYWTNKVTVVQGTTADNTTTLKVRAFSPEDSKRIADIVLSLSESLVNQASQRAVEDAVVFAKKEVDLAHERAMKAFDELQQFEARAKEVDPQGFVQAQTTIQGTLQSNLTALQTQMNSLRRQLPDQAPGIQQMRTQIGVLQEQLISEKNKATITSDGQSASEVITEFGKRQLETQFASQDYLAALTALESARITANQQSRYLEAFDPPVLPDEPSYPWRWYDIITVLAVSSLFYGVWSLFIAGVKEHQH